MRVAVLLVLSILAAPTDDLTEMVLDAWEKQGAKAKEIREWMARQPSPEKSRELTKRWKEIERGKAPTLIPSSAKPGHAGVLPSGVSDGGTLRFCRVFQVLDGNNALIHFCQENPGRPISDGRGGQVVVGKISSRVLFWYRGDTANMVDGKQSDLQGWYAVTDTTTYTTNAGSNTVPVIEPVPEDAMPTQEQIEQARLKGKAGERRTWYSRGKKFKVDARFVDYADRTVRLLKDDDTIISVPLSKLSQDDQAYVREQVRK